MLTTSALQVHIDSTTRSQLLFSIPQEKSIWLKYPVERSLTHHHTQKILTLNNRGRNMFSLPTNPSSGLGQHEDGPWNYRGQTVHLMQSNRNIALPVLISSRGYGLFWDNPAITDVQIGISGKENIVAWNSRSRPLHQLLFLRTAQPLMK